MGCQLSVPEPTPARIGKAERNASGGMVMEQADMLISSGRQRGSMVSSNSSRGATSVVSLETDEDLNDDPPKVDGNGQLLAEEVVRRTSTSLSVSTIIVGNEAKEGGQKLQIDYAYRSQRGYYPDDPKKANQDKYGITLNFAGEPGDAMFAVYDGHGQSGHSAALFAKRRLPQILAKYVRQMRAKKYMSELKAQGKSTKGSWNPLHWPYLETSEFEECCRKAFLETNEAMHDETSFDDSLCGTTAATIHFHDGRMTVCNVGDSRVLLGHRMLPKSAAEDSRKAEEKVDVDTELSYSTDVDTREGEIWPLPLTRDQTPYRKDERERVRKCGAEVRSLDGHKIDWGDVVHGETVNIEGDPPRLWVEGEDYPGTAFTRSLGDKSAEAIGVIAEPEIITKALTVNDEFLVIATDGIFEFLTNSYVMKVCATSLTPLEACERLTKAAYDQWLLHEKRTDDITIIVCFLTCTFQPSPEQWSESTESLVNSVNK